MSAHKNWTKELSEMERVLNSSEDFEAKSLIDHFESIDENFCDQNFSHLYLKLWKVAKNAGQLNLANLYAKKALDFLITYKRIPKIKELLGEFRSEGILKKNSEDYVRKCEILLGKKIDFQNEDLKYFDLMDDHPEHWKEFKNYLKQYLLIVTEWGIQEWKLCYEFILVNQFDKDISFALMERASEMKRADLVKKFEQLFSNKKVKVKKITETAQPKHQRKNEKLHLDYDQVAMDLLSGSIEPNDEEQRRVLSSLKFITEEELNKRGKDMIVAFELLGMEKVVLTLCEQMIKLTEDIKERASLYFIWAQALNNSGDFFKTIDLIDEVLAKEPFYEEERVAFLYLKAEACVKVKKIKMAKEIFAQIKKFNPHYRLVGERLKALETT